MYKGIRFKGYKSFSSDQYHEISDLKYFNVFIGKNNSGKSSVLDVIQGCIDIDFWKTGFNPDQLSVMKPIEDDILKNAFSGYHGLYNKYKTKVNYPIWVQIKGERRDYSGNYYFKYQYDNNNNPDLDNKIAEWEIYIGNMNKPSFSCAKLSAERNIIPELHSTEPVLNADGSGATTLIKTIINSSKYDETIIEKSLLNALNEIMGNDAAFEQIRVQELYGKRDNGESYWEVFLQEKNSGRFPLSQSGSGLKTIILVLLNLLVLPKYHNNTKFIYGFEELENNLHPALQRRLFEYIYNFAVSNKVYIFMTTHSHVAINMFFDKENANIFHVVKSNQQSTIKKIDNYLDKAEILDDLDVKASDLLQANGVIWVEGPSDRIYIKKWLEVFCGNDVQEGVDFQFAYYGGRLLSHYTAEEENDLLNVLLINRNSAIVMDSDKRNQQTKINDTKKRIQKEFQDKHLFSWITKGKEIENYIPLEAIRSILSVCPSEQCGQYDLFPEYINPFYNNFTSQKFAFANRIKEYLAPIDILDLESNIKQLYTQIKRWNN